MTEQDSFNMMIGELDNLLSKMVRSGKEYKEIGETPNRQTLKHHAEDMILAGRKILKDLNYPEPESV